MSQWDLTSLCREVAVNVSPPESQTSVGILCWMSFKSMINVYGWPLQFLSSLNLMNLLGFFGVML